MKGFPNEESFLRLLTTHVKTLIFSTTALTDTMLLRIGQDCQDLQELMISANDCHFTRQGLCDSIHFMKNLQVLQIIGKMEIDDTVIAIISANCRRLKSLWINDCRNVDDACAESLRSMQLLELNVANTKVKWIHKSCERNMTIQAPLLIQITDGFLQTLMGSVLMGHLRDICLKNCSITKNGLIHLNWSRLENINIIGASIDGIIYSSNNTAVFYAILTWLSFPQIYHSSHRMLPTRPSTGQFEIETGIITNALSSSRLPQTTQKHNSRMWCELTFFAIFFPFFYLLIWYLLLVCDILFCVLFE